MSDRRRFSRLLLVLERRGTEASVPKPLALCQLTATIGPLSKWAVEYGVAGAEPIWGCPLLLSFNALAISNLGPTKPFRGGISAVRSSTLFLVVRGAPKCFPEDFSTSEGLASCKLLFRLCLEFVFLDRDCFEWLFCIVESLLSLRGTAVASTMVLWSLCFFSDVRSSDTGNFEAMILKNLTVNWRLKKVWALSLQVSVLDLCLFKALWPVWVKNSLQKRTKKIFNSSTCHFFSGSLTDKVTINANGSRSKSFTKISNQVTVIKIRIIENNSHQKSPVGQWIQYTRNSFRRTNFGSNSNNNWKFKLTFVH